MKPVDPATTFPESFFELRQQFSTPWLDRWASPNPFLVAMEPALKQLGVTLTDFSFNKDPVNVSDNVLTVAIRKLNASVRVGLDFVAFSAANPEWGDPTTQLISTFEKVTQAIHNVIQSRPASQEGVLALHVVSEKVDFRATTGALVQKQVLGESVFYGITLHQMDRSIMIDRSLRYDHAAFVRIQRKHSGAAPWAEIASKLYDDELFALQLLGLIEEGEDAPRDKHPGVD